MLNKSLLTLLISFPLILEVVIEFDMENNCLETGILINSFPCMKSYSTPKALLKCCIPWEAFISGGSPSPPHSRTDMLFPLRSHNCLNLSHK